MMIGAVYNIVMNHADRHCDCISESQAHQFFKQLQLEAFQKQQEILSEVTLSMILHSIDPETTHYHFFFLRFPMHVSGSGHLL
jgi:hypothetical protein